MVYTINKGSARNPHLMQILRTLYFFCAAFDLTVIAQHIPGTLNSSTDALSHNNLALFFSLHPQTSPPTPISQDLRNLTLTSALLWTGQGCSMLSWAISRAIHLVVIISLSALH